MKSLDKPGVVSLFSGCGGSSLGYHLAGYKILLAAEWDENAYKTYQLNFPDTKIFKGDIKELTVNAIKQITNLKKGELDLLDGSPPCQGFSLSGKKEVCDPRNQLYHEYVRILQGLQPKTFVMENVTGLIKGKNKVIFKQILIDLKNSGYNVKVKKMNTKYYNVPQSRERIIFIGVRRDLKISPSHPKPQTAPVPIKDALKNVKPEIMEKASPSVLKYIKKVKPGEYASEAHPKGHHFNRYLLDINKPVPTLTTKGYGDYIFPDTYRRLTPNEAKILSSFPEDFKLIGTPHQQFARIGNSVPPNLMKAIAEHIKNNILNKTK